MRGEDRKHYVLEEKYTCFLCYRNKKIYKNKDQKKILSDIHKFLRSCAHNERTSLFETSV